LTQARALLGHEWGRRFSSARRITFAVISDDSIKVADSATCLLRLARRRRAARRRSLDLEFTNVGNLRDPARPSRHGFNYRTSSTVAAESSTGLSQYDVS
jgi:hypothetical protein